MSRQLSLPVSTMSQWWVSRSRSAVVIFGSPHTVTLAAALLVRELCSALKAGSIHTELPVWVGNGPMPSARKQTFRLGAGYWPDVDSRTLL